MRATLDELVGRHTFGAFGPMRTALVAGTIVLLSGCVDPSGVQPRPSLDWSCPAPCEVLVDGGPERAFEPDAAIDPRDPNHWVIGSSVFHESDEQGTPLYVKSHVTWDAGRTWSAAPFPGSLPPGDPMAAYTHGGDPTVTILDDGTVLLAAMLGTGVLHPPASPGSSAFRPFDIVVGRSVDGGLTFPEYTVVASGSGVMGNPPGNPFPGILLVGEWPDHPMLASGPNGRVLLGYQLRVAQGGPHQFLAMTAVSMDGGRTWSEPSAVRDGGSFGSIAPSVLEDGSFWISYRDVSVEPRYVWTASSPDGKAWQSTIVDGIRTGWPQDSATHGTARWIALAPGEEGGVEEVAVLRSEGSAGPWRQIRVDEAEAEGFSMPQVVAGPRGAIVSYYLARSDGSTEYRAAFVPDEGAVKRVTLSSSAIGKNEFLGGGWAKFGDYVGLSASEDGVLAAWISGDGTGADVQAAYLPWPRMDDSQGITG